MEEGGVFGNHPTSRRRDLRRYEGVVVDENVARGDKMYGFRVADRRRRGSDFYSVRELRDLGHADVRCAQRGGCSDERDAAHDRRRLSHAIRAVDGFLAGRRNAWWLSVATVASSRAVFAQRSLSHAIYE